MASQPADADSRGLTEGDSVRGRVQAVNDFGVFLDVGATSDALLPWSQVDGSGPEEGAVLDLEVAKVYEEGRLTLRAPSNKGRDSGAMTSGETSDKHAVNGFMYDMVLGVRPRRKGGKGDGRGAYSYPDGVQLTDLTPNANVSGHVTNIERGGCWVDIGAVKDAFLGWENAPEFSVRWQVGDMVDDLKVLSAQAERIALAWDDEGVSGAELCQPTALKVEDEGPVTGENCCALYGSAAVLEYAARQEPPNPWGSGPGPGTAAPKATALGSAGGMSIGAGRSGVQDPDRLRSKGPGKAGGKARPRWSCGAAKGAGKSRGWGAEPAHAGKGKGKGAGRAGEEAGNAKGKGWYGFDMPTGKGKSLGAAKGQREGTKGWGKGEGPAYADADEYGSCLQPAEARARSAPPSRRPRVCTIENLAIGEVVRGRVMSVSEFGVLVDFGCEVEGLIPRTLVALQCKRGQVIPKLNVIGIDVASGKVTLEPLEDK